MITKRQATADEESFIRSTIRAAYHDLIVAQFGSWDEEADDRNWAMHWSPERFQIICLDGAPVGYLVVEVREDHVVLQDIAIQPEHQGQGIGTQVLAGEMDAARKIGLPFRLEVLHKNRAISLYRRLGFKHVDSTETDHRMVYE